MNGVTFDMRALNPEDLTTLRWVIVHGREGGGQIVTWYGELVMEGTPQAEQAEIEAHKALDRAYGGPYTETRLVKLVHRVSRTVETVPAMWEVQV